MSISSAGFGTGSDIECGTFTGDEDKSYLSSYQSLDVQELMLRDSNRIAAYAQYIEKNREVFINKIVIDVGAGTGILSLLAAKAGAKQVYAIEASNISGLCSEVVNQNGYSEIITVLHGRAEDVNLPDGVKADVLISEWMGFYLLHESMLSSVIIARDRFLSPDHGIMVPSVASIFVCPVSLRTYHEQNVSHWNKFHGFDFSPFSRAIQDMRRLQPLIISFPADECLAKPKLVVRIDLAYVDVDEIKNIASMSKFVITKNDLLRAFAVWFDVEFEGRAEGDATSVLSTGPGQPETHWKQTVLVLPETLLVSKEEDVHCSLLLNRDENNPRRYNITVEVPDLGEDSDENEDDMTENCVIDEPENCDSEIVDVDTSEQYEPSIETVIKDKMAKPS